ncbi:MAG: ABC transporter substrate-binding protein, partial [Dehalococcoidia bacterium]
MVIIQMLLALAIGVACEDSGTAAGGGTEASLPPPAPTPTTTPLEVTPATPLLTAKPTLTSTPFTAAVVKPAGTLNVGFKEFGAFSIHPSQTSAAPLIYIGTTVVESLLAQNEKREFVPKLAKEWALSPDSLLWTFQLNEGVQFHRGLGEMTADDVIWSMQEMSAEGSVNVFAKDLERLWKNPDGFVKKVDDYTIQVHTGTPQFDMLLRLSRPIGAWIVSKKEVNELGAEEEAKISAGTGPWEIVEHKTGQFWKFQAVEEHWRKTPEFTELIFWEIPEESTRVANFSVGKMDTINMSLDSKTAVEKITGTKFMRVEGGGTINLGMHGNWYVGHGTPEHKENRPGYNPELPWVSSNPDINSPEWERARKVREALVIAIDRQLIVDAVLHGEGQPLVMWGWENNLHRLPPELRQREYNPERARQLLVEAGYPDGFAPTLTPHIRNIPGEVVACEAIGTMWEDAGIRTKINT